MPAKMKMPDRVITNRKGSASTPAMLCRSSVERRRAFSGRKVKNSRKIRRCITTPDTSAASMASPAAPTIQ
jgi:hypothetical protein